MIDIKAIAEDYDCRREVADVLGPPKQRNTQSWVWNCPFHDDSTPSFHVYEDHYHCYGGCGAHGDVLDFWAWSRNMTLAEIIRENTIRPLTPQEKLKITTRRAEEAAHQLEEDIKRAQEALAELRTAQNWMHYYDALTVQTRALWSARGIPDDWQNFWKLGYSASCPQYHASPSLTIPIFKPGEKEPVQIRHRLLQPPTKGDKYRPEKAGLPAVAFYGDPDLEIKNAERIIVVEGEIKAAVTMLTIDKPLVQVIGVPGIDCFDTINAELTGHDNVWIVPDPGGISEPKWKEKAEVIKGRTILLPGKIDDLINAGNLSACDIFGLMDQARRTA